MGENVAIEGDNHDDTTTAERHYRGWRHRWPCGCLALTRQGIQVQLLEQASQIGEIGAGIQLGPNAFSALDALGVGEAARQCAVFTDHIIMMDAVDNTEVLRVQTGEQFRDRFNGPMR